MRRVICTLLLLALALPAVAASDSPLLVLYKSRDPHHRERLQLVTRHLAEAGFTWEARDVEKLLAAPPDMSRYRGIVTCYMSGEMEGAHRYHGWLVKQLEAGRKVAIIGTYGAYQNLVRREGGRVLRLNESPRDINTFFYPFGLEFFFAFTNDAGRLRVLRKDPRYAEFQVPLREDHVNYYQFFRSVRPDNRPYLVVERTDMAQSQSAFVVHTPYGGMILDGYLEWEDWKTHEKRLRVDLTSFLRECFRGGAPPPVARMNLKGHEELLASHPLPEASPPPAPSRRLRPGEEARRVLVLYKRAEHRRRDDHPVFNRVELVLNYLGLAVDYRAVEDGLPSEEEMGPYRGVVTWYTRPRMPRATAYGEWLEKQVEKGRRVVILGRYGADLDARTSTPSRSVAKLFQRLGMTRTPLEVSRFERLPEVIVESPAMGFERQVNTQDLDYQVRTVSVSPGNRVHFAVEDPYSGRIDLVVTGPWGGVALGGGGFYFPERDHVRVARVYEAIRGKLQPEVALEKTLGAWLVDPFVFFTEALGLEGVPAPCYTSVNGRRIFFAHIDGDGLESLSLVDRARLAGWYILEEILEAYPLVPTTASAITEHVERGGNPYYHPTALLAREIFRLPQVEVATHTATHPFDWVRGDPVLDESGRVAHRPPDLVREIWGSRLFIEENLAPPGKDVELVLWSGATNPDGKALAVAHRAGLLNMNGGDPIFDSEHPSVAGLTPLTMQYGPYRQILGVARNDYVYTLYLTGDKGGQKKLIDHFLHTGSPRRLLPMNLYYHFYSGIYRESLEALKTVLDWVVAREPAMLFASDYCRIVEDFDRTRLGREGGTWWVENGGALREVRFPGRVHVDMLASQGVAGYSEGPDGTYVHLDGSARRKIVLAAAAPSTPYLRECTFQVDRVRVERDRLELGIRGFGRLRMEFGGLAGGPWEATLTSADGNAVPRGSTLPAGADGSRRGRPGAALGSPSGDSASAGGSRYPHPPTAAVDLSAFLGPAGGKPSSPRPSREGYNWSLAPGAAGISLDLPAPEASYTVVVRRR